MSIVRDNDEEWHWEADPDQATRDYLELDRPISPLFAPENLISVYTRAQGIADGALADVSAMAREAGITFPVALTALLQADIDAVPEHQSWQSYDGRLWDVISMFRAAVRGWIPREGDDQCMIYALIMHVGERTFYRVKAVCGPGDDMEPVITLMRVDES